MLYRNALGFSRCGISASQMSLCTSTPKPALNTLSPGSTGFYDDLTSYYGI
jgi:hypothetical protein